MLYGITKSFKEARSYEQVEDKRRVSTFHISRQRMAQEIGSVVSTDSIFVRNRSTYIGTIDNSSIHENLLPK